MTSRGPLQPQPFSVSVISNIALRSQDCSTQNDGIESVPDTLHFCYLLQIQVPFKGFF